MTKSSIRKIREIAKPALAALAAAALALSLTGCTVPTQDKGASANVAADPVTSLDAGAEGNDVPEALSDENLGGIIDETSASTADVEYVANEWSAEVAPDGYKVWGPALVTYSPSTGEYVYSDLDALGRTQAAYALITPADYQREKGEDRETFGKDADKISGWGHNEKVSVTFPNGRIYNGYFYNRSHLIADSLGGTPKRDNLITGTRFQNVGCGSGGGMGYPEDLARNWLASAPANATLYYAATPVYVGDELVPRSVYVDMLSSDGTIDAHIETYNVTGDMTGTYTVDYATGQIIKDGQILR